MRNKPLTVTFYIGNKQVDKLTEEQLSCISARLSEAMSVTDEPKDKKRSTQYERARL